LHCDLYKQNGVAIVGVAGETGTIKTVTASAVLGWGEGETVRHVPLVTPTYYRVQDPADMVQAFPAVIAWATGVNIDGEICTYDTTVRLFTSMAVPSGGFTSALLREAYRYAELARDVIEANTNLSGTADGHALSRIAVSILSDTSSNIEKTVAVADLTLTVNVEED
jgi:hypothetical protein